MFDSNQTNKLKLAGSLLAGCALMFWGAQALAAATDLQGIVGNVKTNVGSLAPLLVIVSYIAGVAFCIAAIVQFKAHKDNATQVPLSKPIVSLAVGAALLFLPSIMKSAGSTIFGGEGGTSAAAGETGLDG
jgi:intracellular multiplication protein IcmD